MNLNYSIKYILLFKILFLKDAAIFHISLTVVAYVLIHLKEKKKKLPQGNSTKNPKKSIWIMRASK